MTEIKNNFKKNQNRGNGTSGLVKKHYRIGITLFLTPLLFVLVGCASIEKRNISAETNLINTEKETLTGKDIKEIEIRQFFLSPGDEIKISVFQHDDLTRSIKIPPDGVIFYPIVGEIDLAGVSLAKLRDTITEGLSENKRQPLFSGDEISITVFRHEEYNRKFIVPSDGSIFFPQVGDINIEEKTLSEIRNIISTGLSQYIVDPQVMIDITELNNLARIADPQVSVEVVSFGGQKVFVLGEVNKPGVFLANGFTDLVEIISMAGGPTLDAEQKSVLVIRKGTEKTKPELIIADLKQFLVDGDATQNIIIKRGDIVFVPRTFISNVDRFFEHLNKIVSPLFDMERGYWVGQNIEAGPSGRFNNY